MKVCVCSGGGSEAAGPVTLLLSMKVTITAQPSSAQPPVSPGLVTVTWFSFVSDDCPANWIFKSNKETFNLFKKIFCIAF